MSRQTNRRKRKRIFWYFAFALGCLCVFLSLQLQIRTMNEDHLQKDLLQAAEDYYRAQAENNWLRTQLAEINSDTFIERVARSKFGYCRYGEIIYEVSNLKDLLPDSNIQVYGEYLNAPSDEEVPQAQEQDSLS